MSKALFQSTKDRQHKAVGMTSVVGDRCAVLSKQIRTQRSAKHRWLFSRSSAQGLARANLFPCVCMRIIGVPEMWLRAQLVVLFLQCPRTREKTHPNGMDEACNTDGLILRVLSRQQSFCLTKRRRVRENRKRCPRMRRHSLVP